MTTPIAPIAAIGQIGSIGVTTGVSGADAAASASNANNFASVLGQGIDSVQNAQSTADNLAVQAATGQLTDPSTYTIAATQAQLMTQLMTTIESKTVEAFNQVMGMQA